MPADLTSKPAPRLPIGLTIATAISLAILLALGSWQLQRLAWKEALLAHVAALKTAPAQPLAAPLTALAQGANVEFTRVTVSCPGLASAPFLELYGLKDGLMGSRLVSACRLADGPYGAILVDRGFVAETVSARPPIEAAATAPLALTGILRLPDKRTFVTPPNEPQANRWYSRDIAAMAAALGVQRPAPTFLFAETATNPDWAALQPAPVPADIPNRHLEYALTWYGLAAALLGVYAAVLLRRRKS